MATTLSLNRHLNDMVYQTHSIPTDGLFLNICQAGAKHRLAHNLVGFVLV